nr:prisilkin-39-like [Cherax quadricarinatus]
MKTFLIILLLVALATAWNKKLFRLFPGPITSRYGYGLGTRGYGYRGYGPVYGGYSPVYKLRPLNKLGFGLPHYIGKRETDSIPIVNEEEKKPKNLYALGYPFYGGFGNVPYGYFNRGYDFYYPSFNTYYPYYYGSNYPWYNY